MYSTSKPIPEILGDIIDTIRKTGYITDVTISGANSIVESVNTLRNNEYVVIDNVDYKVFDVTTGGFKVRGDVSLAINWKAKAPYYEYGHMLEIAHKLGEKNQDNQLKYQKYPLIALKMDFEEDRASRTEININPVIYLIHHSEQNYYAENRLDKVFKPILYPLYEDFIDALSNSNKLNNFSDMIGHSKIDRLFWGRELPMYNDAIQMNDYIDAIEIRNINLRFAVDSCLE